MAAQDLERLVVQLSADIKKYENAMAKAAGATNRRAKEIEGRFSKMNKGLSSQFLSTGSALTKGLLAGLAAGGVAGALGTFREVAASVAEIGTEAKQAGLSVKAFQELRFVADQNKVSVDALTDGMKELSLRADEFIVTGKGSGAEAFQRLGYGASDLATKIKDPSALFTEIIGKLGQLDKAAQIRIADEIFGGTGGEQFVKLIDQGEQGIRDQIKAANDLGIVLDEQVIKRAAEVDRQFNLIAATIGGNLKTAIVDAFTYLNRFADEFRDIQDKQDRTIQGDINRVMSEKQDVAQRLNTVRSNPRLNDRNKTKAAAELEKRLAELDQQENELIQILQNRPSVMRPGTPPSTEKPGSGGGYNGGNTPPASTATKQRADDYARATAALKEHIATMQAEAEAQRGLAGSLFYL